MTIEQVKEILPNVIVCPRAGVLLDCRVTGRLCEFATVAPIIAVNGDWHFSWATIVRAVTNGDILYV